MNWSFNMWKFKGKTQESFFNVSPEKLEPNKVYFSENKEHVVRLNPVGHNYVGLNGKQNDFIILVLDGERAGQVYNACAHNFRLVSENIEISCGD